MRTRRSYEFHEEWTREDAQKAMAARLLGMKPENAGAPAVEIPGMTFGQAVERYLVVKAKKRSIYHDRCHLARLKAAFGADTPLASITAGRISKYKQTRLGATIDRDGTPQPLASATVNRELAALLHLFKLAAEEWEVVDKVPRIRLGRSQKGASGGSRLTRRPG